MPLELLHQLTDKKLPLNVTDIESIDKLRVLRASGHVDVLLPSLGATEPVARVLTITDQGREALRNFEQQSS